MVSTSGDYTVNLCAFYFYKIIGKLTSLLQLQEFSFRNITVTSSTIAAQPSHHRSGKIKSKVDNILAKTHTTDYFEYRRCTCVVQITHSPITLGNLLFINLVSIFRCSSPPRHPVYARRVDPSSLSFSLSSHRKSHISLLFSFRFID
jgi:hypothetical protein